MNSEPRFVSLEVVHSGRRHRVLRGRRASDDMPVIVKTVVAGAPGAESALRHEYHVLRSLSVDGVVRAHALTRLDGAPALVEEDLGPLTLARRLRGSPLSVAEFLPVAEALASIVGAVHAAGVVHRDINPSNVVLRSDTAPCLIDFGIAARLSDLLATARPVGTLDYIAPEQTGRTSRVPDWRADLYSLGATLYELLTGTAPFPSDDPAALVHAHLALRPASPTQRRAAVPLPLSDLVLKLLAKVPDERYQTAEALADDLRRMRRDLGEDGAVRPFALASRDVPPVLVMPTALRGREAPLSLLRSAFDRACEGRPQLVVVSGPAGIGKSALVRAVRRDLHDRPSLYGAGKADQLDRAVPYRVLSEAVRAVMRRLLSEPEPRLLAWREALRRELGAAPGPLVEIVPELGLVMGVEPSAGPEVGPLEARNRLHRLFAALVTALARPAEPLVLALDDMQWVDPASLELLESAFAAGGPMGLLVLGCCRDGEASAATLSATLKAVADAGATVTLVPLAPLSVPEVAGFLSDALHAPPEVVEDLAGVMATRAEGNPFFLQRLLQRMQSEEVLRFDHQRRRWEWDADALLRLDVSDDVVALMLRDLEQLPPACRETLEVAACIGSRFSLALIAAVRGAGLADTIEALLPAAERGLVVAAAAQEGPRSSPPAARGSTTSVTRFAFSHDRVQEAAYRGIDPGRRDALHRRVAAILLERAEGYADDRLFDVVDQLRLGARCITAPDERAAARDLALRAGRKARQAAAYRAALGYLDLATSLLPEDPWAAAPEVAFEVHAERARCAYLSGEHRLADALVDASLERAPDLVSKAELLDLRVMSATVDGRYAEGVDLARASAALFGERVPARGEPVDIAAALAEVDRALDGRSPERIADMPEATDPTAVALMRVLSRAVAAAYFSDTGVFAWLNARAVMIAMRDGPTPDAAFSLVAHGMVVGVTDAAEGYAFGRAGVAIARRRDDPAGLCRALHTFAAHIHHWSRPLSSDLPLAREAMRVGVEGGEHQFACYAAAAIVLHRWSAGHDLDDVIDDAEAGLELARRTSHRDMTLLLRSFEQGARAVRGLTSAPWSLDADGFDDAEHLAAVAVSPTATFLHRVLRAQLAVYWGDLARAREELEAAKPLAPFALGLFGVADLSFYEALASPEAAGEREAELARWAEQCPENFAHKVDLVAALRLAAAGERWAAVGRFERSIEGARSQGFTQDEAMARERLAEFLRAEGMPGMAASSASAAVAAWRRWGAGPKADALARRWSNEAVRHPRGSTTGEAELSFDALSVAKASQALSEHVVLNLLLERVVRVVLESAGGTGGALVLDEDGALTVRARGEADAGSPVDLAPLRLEECPDLPRSVLELSFRTAEPVVLADAAGAGQFVDDPAVRARAIRSVLCVPLRYGGRVAGLVYLESLVATRAFTRDRVDLVQHLATQLAISLQNSHLFESLRREVRERERAEEALLRANDDLEARIAARTAELERVARSEREAREALERTQAHLVQSEKLASLGQMVAGIAHEINNPLSFVNNNVAVLQRDVTAAMEILDAWGESRPLVAERDPALAARIDAMSERLDLGYVKGRLPGVFKSTREGMRRITQIVADLRVFARLDLGDSEETDLNAGVTSTLHILRVRAEGRGVALVADLGRPVRVRCQPAKVNQVVMNLVANAIDATPAGSAVMVTTRHRPGWFELIVDDEGEGVPEALRTRIFDPFFTTKPQGEGTGLGLSISYGIAREHGGEVTVGDAPGGGARFTLRLPME